MENYCSSYHRIDVTDDSNLYQFSTKTLKQSKVEIDVLGYVNVNTNVIMHLKEMKMKMKMNSRTFVATIRRISQVY